MAGRGRRKHKRKKKEKNKRKKSLKISFFKKIKNKYNSKMCYVKESEAKEKAKNIFLTFERVFFISGK